MAQLFEKQWPMQPGNGWALDKLIVSRRLKHVKEVWRQTAGQGDTNDAEAEVDDPEKANDGDPNKDGDSDDDGNSNVDSDSDNNSGDTSQLLLGRARGCQRGTKLKRGNGE